MQKRVCCSLCSQYIPVVMQQAKLYWDLGLYSRVEKIFSKSEEFCKDNDTWRLNMAHVLYMQGNKYKEAAGFYEPVVKKHYKDVSLAFINERVT